MVLQTQPYAASSAYLPNPWSTGIAAPATGVKPARPQRPATLRPMARAITPANTSIGAAPPAIAPLPSGIPPAPAIPPVAGKSPTAAPAPAPGGNSGMTFQVTGQGQTGLNNMGIPAPPTYTPRAPAGPIFSGNNAQTGGGSMYVPSGRNAAQAAVDRYTGGMTVTSNPTTQGSAHNGGIGGPSQVAALNSWQAAQNNAQMLQSFGWRGDQMANNDYGYGAGGGGFSRTGAAGGTGQSAQTGIGAGGGGTGTGGINGTDTLNNLASATDAQQRRAEEANEQRYRDILSGHGSAYDRNMATLDGMGESERASLNRRHDASQGRNTQEAISRGLGGTTVLPGMRTLTERERTQDLGDLDERLRRERIGLDTQLSGNTLSFMERREDVAPDPNALINLAMALGQAGDNSQVQPSYYPPYGAGADMSPIYIGNGLSGGGGGGYQGNMGGGYASFYAPQMGGGGGQQQQPQPAPRPFQRDPLRYVGLNDFNAPNNWVDVDPRRLQQFSNYV